MPLRRFDMITKQLDETKQETTPRRNRMAIRDWHLGQLVVFWVGGLLLAWLFYLIAKSIYDDPPNLLVEIVGLIFVIGLLVVPAALLIVTWKWFGGRNPPPL